MGMLATWLLMLMLVMVTERYSYLMLMLNTTCSKVVPRADGHAGNLVDQPDGQGAPSVPVHLPLPHRQGWHKYFSYSAL